MSVREYLFPTKTGLIYSNTLNHKKTVKSGNCNDDKLFLFSIFAAEPTILYEGQSGLSIMMILAMAQLRNHKVWIKSQGVA